MVVPNPSQDRFGTRAQGLGFGVGFRVQNVCICACACVCVRAWVGGWVTTEPPARPDAEGDAKKLLKLAPPLPHPSAPAPAPSTSPRRLFPHDRGVTQVTCPQPLSPATPPSHSAPPSGTAAARRWGVCVCGGEGREGACGVRSRRSSKTRAGDPSAVWPSSVPLVCESPRVSGCLHPSASPRITPHHILSSHPIHPCHTRTGWLFHTPTRTSTALPHSHTYIHRIKHHVCGEISCE